MIYDRIENLDLYGVIRNQSEILDYLKDFDVNADVGKYDLPEGMFAMVSKYETLEESQAVLESHRKYIDIQLLLMGSEKIKIYDARTLKVKEEYSQEKDVLFYTQPKQHSCEIHLVPGHFALFLPGDAHMPCLKDTNINQVKKIVLKIPIE